MKKITTRTTGLFLFILILLGCSREESYLVDIRIRNVSTYDFENVVIDTEGGEGQYGNIPSKGSSGYKTFTYAYRYAFVELQIDGVTFTLQPNDYTGEKKLDEGSYTYEIDAGFSDEQNGWLSLVLVND